MNKLYLGFFALFLTCNTLAAEVPPNFVADFEASEPASPPTNDRVVLFKLKNVPVVLKETHTPGAWAFTYQIDAKYSFNVRFLDFNVLDGKPGVRLDYGIGYSREVPNGGHPVQVMQILCESRLPYRSVSEMEALAEFPSDAWCTDRQNFIVGASLRKQK